MDCHSLKTQDDRKELDSLSFSRKKNVNRLQKINALSTLEDQSSIDGKDSGWMFIDNAYVVKQCKQADKQEYAEWQLRSYSNDRHYQHDYQL